MSRDEHDRDGNRSDERNKHERDRYRNDRPHHEYEHTLKIDLHHHFHFDSMGEEFLSCLSTFLGDVMEAIKLYAAKQQEFNDKQAAAIDSIVASQAGLSTDIAALAQTIADLQASAGVLNAEDQGLLDTAQAQSEALTAKAETVAAALQALDAQNPPAVPAA